MKRAGKHRLAGAPRRRHRSHTSLLMVLCASLLAVARPSRAEPPPAHPGFYAEMLAGPAFATFSALDASSNSSNEHLATGGEQIILGVGYGWEPRWLRIDLGLRLRNLRLGVAGKYNAGGSDDSFRAAYDYIGPAIGFALSTRLASRVNPFLGFTLGTATFVSDGQGRPLSTRQIAIIGTFEAGFLVRLTNWLDTRAGVSWQPPFGTNLMVITPEFGLRARF